MISMNLPCICYFFPIWIIQITLLWDMVTIDYWKQQITHINLAYNCASFLDNSFKRES